MTLRLPFVALAALLAGCVNGELNLLGYSTAPPFDPNVRTVYVPVFKNLAFVTTPHRGIEVDVTEAVVRELGNRRSPIRVTSDPANADTELVGTIIDLQKIVLNRNNQNYTRELELVLTAEVVWRDLRTGRILTGGRVKPAAPPEAFDPSLPPPPDAPPPPFAAPGQAARIVAVGRAIPELGESNASAQKKAVDQMAEYVVNLMEKPW